MAEITKQALKVDNNQSFPNNNNGAITPSILRAFNTNMIDSMVDEIGYTADSSSWNQQIDALEQFTASAAGLTTGSLLVTASAVSNVITFTKGNGSTFNVTVADTTDLGPLNSFTASAQISLNNLNQWTSSYQPVIVNLQASQSIDTTKFTTIGTQSGSWDNTSLNSYTASNDTKWNTLGTLSGSFVTESETGSFARTDASNTFTQTNIFTSISASSFVSASAFVGDGSKITNITASISLPILDEGIPQGNAFSMNFTGSAISAIVVGGTAVVSVNAISTASLNTLTQSFNDYTASTDAKFVAVGASTSSLNAFTASQQTINTNVSASQSIDTTKWDTLGTQSGSWVNVPLDSLNSFTQSQDTKNTTLATYTASVDTKFTAVGVSTSSLNTFTGSQDTKNSTLATYTASVDSSLTNINSFTASNGNTSLNSYTQSNDTKWSNLAGQTGSYVTSAITASSLVTASAVGNTITFIKGDASTFDVSLIASPIDTGSFATTASLNAYTQSNDQRVSSLETNSASVNISISNINTATASLFTSASLALVTASFSGNTLTFTKGDTTTFAVVIPDVSGSTINTGSFATTGSNTFIGNQIISGNVFPQVDGQGDLGSDTFKWNSITVNGQLKGSSLNTTGRGTVGTLRLSDESFPLSFLGDREMVGDGTGANTHMYYATSSSDVNGLREFVYAQSGSDANFTSVSASFNTRILAVTGSTINTGSFATTGSNTFTGNQTISSSLFISGNINMVNGSDLVTHHVKAAGSNGLELQTSAGAIIVSMGAGGGTQATFVGAVSANSISASTINGLGDPLAFSTSVDSRLDGLEALTSSYVTSAITASSVVTASVNLNTITFTKGDASTFALTVNTGSGGGGAAFPFTGNAVITGSLGISGSMFGGVITLSVASTTASVDFSAANMFTLSLPSASTHINPTNIRAGQTVNIQITQPTPGTGSVTFPSNVKFAGGNDYQATTTGSAIDMLTLVSYDGTNVLATSIKNFL